MRSFRNPCVTVINTKVNIYSEVIQNFIGGTNQWVTDGAKTNKETAPGVFDPGARGAEAMRRFPYISHTELNVIHSLIPFNLARE